MLKSADPIVFSTSASWQFLYQIGYVITMKNATRLRARRAVHSTNRYHSRTAIRIDTNMIMLEEQMSVALLLVVAHVLHCMQLMR